MEIDVGYKLQQLRKEQRKSLRLVEEIEKS